MTDQQLSDSEIGYRLALRSAARNYNRTLVIAALVGAVVFFVLTLSGAFDAGVLFCVGLGLGVLNSQLVQRSLVGAITSGTADRRTIAFGVLRRLSLVTAIAVAVAFLYQPHGWVVFVGLMVFQMLITFTVFGTLARQVRRA